LCCVRLASAKDPSAMTYSRKQLFWDASVIR
jgi:hypothetical protein